MASQLNYRHFVEKLPVKEGKNRKEEEGSESKRGGG